MDQEEIVSLSAEEEVAHQLLQQLSICKRAIADCSASLIELSPLVHQNIPSLPEIPDERHPGSPAATDKAPPTTALTHTKVTIWERELKETQEACKELECVAEDRENRLNQLERSLADSERQVMLLGKECEELRSKYEFQVEVSQRVARHYHTLNNSTNSFQTMFQSMESSVEQSRYLFGQSEQKIIILQALQTKLSQTMAKRREMASGLEKSLRSQEMTSNELQRTVTGYQLQIRDIQAQLDTARTELEETKGQLQAQSTSQINQVDLTSTQSTLIETLQASHQQLKSELKMLQEQIGSVSISTECAMQAEDGNTATLQNRILLLSTRVEEMTQHRSELVSYQKTLVDSLIAQRDEANAEKKKMEEKLAEIEKQNTDLRELLVKPRHAGRGEIHQHLQPQARIAPASHSPKAAVGDGRGNSFGSTTSRPLPNSPNGRFSNSTQMQSSSVFRPDANPLVMNDSVMEVDENEDPLRPLSPLSPMRSRPLDLLGDFNTDLLQYRGLKCCGEPALGFTITCGRCQEMFHLSCVEAIRNKAIPKKQKFVCYVCDPSTKSSRPRKPRLTVMENSR